MAALRPLRRVLLYGIMFGALALAAPASGASVTASPAPTVAVGALLDENGRGGSEALLQYVYWNRFCQGYSRHPICLKLVLLRQFCERHPKHRQCEDDDEDRFCRKHPYHHRCDDPPPSPS